MPKVILFCEDNAHEAVLQSVLRHLATSTGIDLDIDVRSAIGGAGRVVHELKKFVKQFRMNQERLPDLLVIGRDANCRGVVDREKELTSVMKDFGGEYVFAIPDPHIERWLLLDSAAFKHVFGKGCDLPDQKCDKDRYKQLLRHAIRDANHVALLGGIEYAEDIVSAMDLRRIEAADSSSFGRFLKEMRRYMKRWQQ